MSGEIYTEGEYLKNNPTWHIEDSPRKGAHILEMLSKSRIQPRTICEAGCGAGGILKELKDKMDERIKFFGYDISSQAIELAKRVEDERLHFYHNDLLQQGDAFFDLVLIIDVVEHIEDYFGFLRGIKTKGQYKLFRIPLDLNVYNVLRPSRIMGKRRSVGHIHYFTKETALQTLKDCGYELIDHQYSICRMRSPIAILLKRGLYLINKDIGVRIFGGYSLLVLAK